MNWWRGAAIYQIYPRSFYDATGDGVGDLPGIIEKLDYVADLGVDAIWLSPFYRSPMRDGGYDVADHRAVDPRFGTLDDAERLIRLAHEAGLKVILDQVWSHTSDQHPWFRESRDDRNGAKADWYVWADPRPDGTPPNNWLSVFGGSAWQWEPRRRQYYLHHFLSSQPALNLRRPAVRRALAEIGRFWLDRGVDGFRLDAVDFYLHDEALRDNPARPPADGAVPLKPFGLQEHRYDMMQADTPALLAELRGAAFGASEGVLLGELSSQPDALRRCQRYSAPGKLDMAYSLQLMKGDLSAERFKVALAEAIEGEREAGGWLCWSFSNHDVERTASRWNPAGDPALDRLLAALLLALRGTACIYQGEELGLPEAELAWDELADPFGKAFWPHYKGRDGARTPLPWHPCEPHAGFMNGAGHEGRPWLPLPEAHRRLAIGRQCRESGSLLQHWRRLLAWRRRQPALAQGALTLESLPDPLLGFRRGGDDGLLCLFNLSSAPQRVARAALAGIAGGGDAPGASGTIRGGELSLPGYGYLFAPLAGAR